MNNDFPDNEDRVDGFSDVSSEGQSQGEPHEQIPGPPDPGVADDALEPLSPEERMRLERETEDLVDGRPGEGASQQAASFGQGDEAGGDFGEQFNQRGIDVENQDDDPANLPDNMGQTYVEGELGTANTGGVGGGLAGTRVGNASGPVGGSNLPDLETGRGDLGMLEDDEEPRRTGTDG
jgi:hypothetical protein